MGKPRAPIRIETPDGCTLGTAVKRLERYISERAAAWPDGPDGECFEPWAREVVAGALRNLAASVAVERLEGDYRAIRRERKLRELGSRFE